MGLDDENHGMHGDSVRLCRFQASTPTRSSLTDHKCSEMYSFGRAWVGYGGLITPQERTRHVYDHHVHFELDPTTA